MEVTGKYSQVRLDTVDAHGRRIWVYPADVKGWFRRRRSALSVVLIAIFLVLPWIRINGHQALLLNVAEKRFSVLGLAFWAHDAPLLLFVPLIAIVGIALLTAVFGRVWCGWACPQTVFVEMVFRRVERWIEGDAFRRKALDRAPWSAEKVLKKASKWALFSLIALVLSHSFLAYFVGTEELGRMIRSSPSRNPGAFLMMLGMFALVLFDFGWFREQFCTLICPYGRFQTVLLDERSWVVAYDEKRGEPRRGVAPAATPGCANPLEAQKRGDCISCNRCVQVCPTGIDIRKGLQVECVACTSCMDACDAVMTKIGKPTGLIRYSSTFKDSFFRPRPLIYLGILSGLIAGLAAIVQGRSPVEVVMIRAPGEPFQTVIRDDAPMEVVNHFRLELQNQTFEPRKVSLSMPVGTPPVQIISTSLPAELAPGETKRIDFFLRFGKGVLNQGKAKLNMEIRSSNGMVEDDHLETKEVRLVGPIL